ncbi:MAG: SRPBCC family protein [Polyangiaceae bacterium]
MFPFFADAFNLERITPPELRFEIVTPPPIEIRAGTLIDYRLRLFGVPFGWRTLIESFEDGVSFVDRQLRGPYKRWHHTHAFERSARTDAHVRSGSNTVPLGPLGEIRALAVTRQVSRIFDYRREVIARQFGRS